MIYIYLYILYYCGRNIYFEKFFFFNKKFIILWVNENNSNYGVIMGIAINIINYDYEH